MTDLTERIAALPPRHRALFERSLLQKGLDPRSVCGIPRRAVQNFCPLTIDQERLWFIDQLQPGTPAYNISSASRLEGALDLAALTRGVEELVRLHEILRTAFPAEDGEPRQFISESLKPELPTVDLSAVPADEREAELQSRMTARTQEPFDLSAGPLLRLTLYRLREPEHVLLVTMHHTITDRWSFSLFWRELSLLYSAYAAGERPTLAELPIQFADYAVWQRQQLAGEGLAERLGYWRRQLAGAPDVLTLPTDFARPPVAGHRGARLFWSPPRPLWEELRRFNQRHGVTMFMTMLAAFNILLRRYTGQESINVGSPFANRDRVETEGLIGFLLNMLVLRTDLSGDPSVLALLGRVRETALGAYEHSDLPFGLLVQELQPVRDLGRNPLYQVAFVLVDMQDTVTEVAGLRMSSVEVLSGLSRLDLMLGLRDDAESPTVLFEYNAELFEERTVARMLGHLEVLLGAMLEGPERRISELPLLTVDERRQLLLEFNDPTAAQQPDRCLHELFAEQAARTPEATAVVCRGERLSYVELDEAAGRLARVLGRAGVGAESAVGLSVERSTEMIVGLLGILKAGAAFVPLDPGYPSERLAFMLEDAGVEVLLTQRELLARLSHLDARVLCAGTDWHDDGDSRATVEARALPDNLAYVIYTSGSTGRPKGTLCTHRGVANLLSDFSRRGWGGAGSRCSFWTSLSFDVSLYEIFCPLLTGGELHVVPEELRADGAAFIEWLRAREIECAYLPPFLLPALGEWLAHEGRTLSLRSLLVGVEPIRERVLGAISERLGGLRIVNGYGPTEASVCATLYEMPAHARGETHAPIGRPICGNGAHVLGDTGQLAPVGVTGELHVGGVGLARGYAGRPALTAEKFAPDPFSAEPGARLYRTGDLARWSGEGQLEFVGRLDQQLKLRGHRVESGEIEAVLCEHPEVLASVVTTDADETGHRRLVAYIVPRGVAHPAHASLREWLRRRVPEYMLPAVFVQLEALPLTPNGKLDRRALPPPETSGATRHHDFTPPRKPTETLLAGIWAEHLRVESVGVHEGFFELGGHSLLAAPIVSRVRQLFQVELSLQQFFEAGTVAGLATVVEELLYAEVASMSEEEAAV